MAMTNLTVIPSSAFSRFTADGMPTSISLLGNLFDEETVQRCKSYQDATNQQEASGNV
jgi:hypothetical protein